MKYRNFLTNEVKEYTEYTMCITYNSGQAPHYHSVNRNRQGDIRDYMKRLLSEDKNIASIRLVSEPLGETEYEYVRKLNGEIEHNSWSNCD